MWSDWSQIEARILPWLAGDSPGARARLYVFRDVDADPRRPDLSRAHRCRVVAHPVFEVTKELRQRGKVAELALGYGGGVGALHDAAAGYGRACRIKSPRLRWMRGARPARGACGSGTMLQHAVETRSSPPLQGVQGRAHFLHVHTGATSAARCSASCRARAPWSTAPSNTSVLRSWMITASWRGYVTPAALLAQPAATRTYGAACLCGECRANRGGGLPAGRAAPAGGGV